MRRASFPFPFPPPMEFRGPDVRTPAATIIDATPPVAESRDDTVGIHATS